MTSFFSCFGLFAEKKHICDFEKATYVLAEPKVTFYGMLKTWEERMCENTMKLKKNKRTIYLFTTLHPEHLQADTILYKVHTATNSKHTRKIRNSIYLNQKHIIWRKWLTIILNVGRCQYEQMISYLPENPSIIIIKIIVTIIFSCCITLNLRQAWEFEFQY